MAPSPMTRLVQLLAFSLLGLGGGILALTAHRTLVADPAPAPAAPPEHPPANLPPEVSPPATALNLADRWIVDPDTAHTLITNGATVLDARNARSQLTGILQGAVAVSWRQFSQPTDSERGKLADLATLQAQLQAVGVSGDRPVVVLADPLRGWGEDGRIVWMLRSLGHEQAVMVDGGYAALVTLGLPTTLRVARTAAQPGDFVPALQPEWQIEREAVQRRLDDPDVALIDTRTPAEYEGAILFNEERGGHLPGAILLERQELLDAQGRLLPRAEILQILQAHGITSDQEIVAYCTGGIRSAWLVAVLADMGLAAKNYPGSMWEWAAAPAIAHPLVTP